MYVYHVLCVRACVSVSACVRACVRVAFSVSIVFGISVKGEETMYRYLKRYTLLYHWLLNIETIYRI